MPDAGRGPCTGAQQGLRCSILPGEHRVAIPETAAVRRLVTASPSMIEELSQELLDALPLGEPTPTDVAEVITFLAYGRARHTTGATIDITGADYVRQDTA
jgi:NAD(P)-dependent dehydrogenase (short-subunit alcohol dehydrogenase family)